MLLAVDPPDDEGKVRIFFESPPESPTVRGYAGILHEGLDGESPEAILAIPNDFYLGIGLEQMSDVDAAHLIVQRSLEWFAPISGEGPEPVVLVIPRESDPALGEGDRILMHACELLAGQRYSDRTFSAAGQTGARHREQAKEKIVAWLLELRSQALSCIGQLLQLARQSLCLVDAGLQHGPGY